MKLRNTSLRAATVRIFASASTSVSEPGRARPGLDAGSSVPLGLMVAGTMASVIDSSESWPTSRSMCATSASLGPMWRSTKESWCSSSRRLGLDMAEAPEVEGAAGSAAIDPGKPEHPLHRARAGTARAGLRGQRAQAIHCGGAPLSFCLRVWKRAVEDRLLRAPSAPVPAGPVGLSRVLPRPVVSGLSDYGRLRLRQHGRALCFSHHCLAIIAPGIPPIASADAFAGWELLT